MRIEEKFSGLKELRQAIYDADNNIPDISDIKKSISDVQDAVTEARDKYHDIHQLVTDLLQSRDKVIVQSFLREKGLL